MHNIFSMTFLTFVMIRIRQGGSGELWYLIGGDNVGEGVETSGYRLGSRRVGQEKELSSTTTSYA